MPDGSPRVNIIEKSDEEIRAIADPLWRDLVRYSNEGKYGEFVKHFSSSLALAMNQVVAGHQFANSELAREPVGRRQPARHHPPGRACDGALPAAEHDEKQGEWLGRLVLGHENGEVRIFGASIF